jgi:soluble lytic murein transglycosylase
MQRWRLFCLYSLTALSLLTTAHTTAEAASPAKTHTTLNAADRAHAKNAFYFAERDNWHEAVLHASRASNTALRDYMVWRALLTDNSGYDFAAYNSFLARNPGWPLENRLISRAEDILFSGASSSLSNSQILQWFKLHPPITGKGKIVYAKALKAQNALTAQITPLVRDAWINGDYDSAQEKILLQFYGDQLRQQDHIARTDRLIWEEKYTAAGRMMFLLPNAEQNLFEARILLALNKPGVNNAVGRIPAKLRNDPGLIYERMKWRERKGLTDGVEELLLAAPATVPYPEKWWRTRHILAREAFEQKRYSHAMKLLSNHGQTEGIPRADALWLQGWISSEFLKKPEEAYGYFLKLEQGVKYPVSKSRAQYWLGRTSETMGKTEQAHKWYATAATHNTTFYGQLGASKAQQNARMLLPRTASPTQQQLQEFLNDSRVKVVYMLAESGYNNKAYTFIGHLMEEASTQSQALMVAQLGAAIQRTDYSVLASKDAAIHHYVLPQTGYPYYRLTFTPLIEEGLMWAITRQESLFNHTAGSSAGARGLMQLLPSTAQEVARKNNFPYDPSHLENPMANLRLGSTYLATQINAFNGSYIMAIAGYNAGPGRVRQWEGEFGRPGSTPEAAINWIERIPFPETRNYVQRVLENLQVYRAIVDPRQGQYIQIERDLTR